MGSSFIISFATNGFSAPDVAITVVRIAIGMFFAFSGTNKLFNTGRHQSITKTLENDHVPFVGFMQWWVPAWEFLGGIALAVGFMTAAAAGILAIICLVACFCEAKSRVDGYQPINAIDRVDDYLYLQEVLYILFLAMFIFGVTSPYSVDALLF